MTRQSMKPSNQSTLWKAILLGAYLLSASVQVGRAQEETRVTVKKMLASTESALEADLFESDGSLESAGATGAATGEEDLLARKESLFQADALDVQALNQMDCHLRNLDYCFAGIMATSSQALPDSDAAFEARCDELKAASSCMAVYNKRCSTLKLFALLTPAMSSGGLAEQLPVELRDAPIPAALESLLMNTNHSGQLDESSLSDQQRSALNQVQLRGSDMSSLCEPSAKHSKTNRLLRLRLFQVARCVNQRMPQLRPCIEDLKVALQLFYEPARSLPLKPTCCAFGRFRQCASEALDNICGISSFKQLEASLISGAGAPMQTVQRLCRQADNFESPFCTELLPPRGMKAPTRRGRKASKLAKALDLISFAPAAQDS